MKACSILIPLVLYSSVVFSYEQKGVHLLSKTDCLALGSTSKPDVVSFSGVFKSSLFEDKVFVNFHCEAKNMGSCYIIQVRWGEELKLSAFNPSKSVFKPQSFQQNRKGTSIGWENMTVQTNIKDGKVEIVLKSILKDEQEVLSMSCL